jgi:cytochrome c oxidase cbb3-type subunit 3
MFVQQLMAENGEPPKESSLNDPIVLTMVIVMLILLLAIILLGNVVVGTASFFLQKEKEKEKKENASKTTITATCIAGLLMLSAPIFAQDTNAPATIARKAISFGSLSPTAFYAMSAVLVVELVVIFVLLFQLRIFLAKEKKEKINIEVEEKTVRNRVSFWDKMNSFRPVEQEAQIDMGHEYDGIRELDNRLPPWWLYGFYICIIFAVIYLWRFHVSHTAPLAKEELQIAMQEAEIQKENYLKKSANNVDENNVTLLADASAIAGGKAVYIQNCAACHGKDGEGVVGPNLTDDYWLHGGSVQDVFKTIKYGWPEKGMKSWKDDLTPVQVAQVASFIKSLHGSNPANAKEKQGDLFQETPPSNDANKADSSATEKKVAGITHS